MGKDSASLAQSKCGAAGIEHGGMELRGFLMRDGGCKTVAMRGSDLLAAAEDSRVSEMVHLWLIWGKPGGTGFFMGVDGE